MHVELLVEEPSMEAFLQALLPRLLPGACSHMLPEECRVLQQEP